jgi:hypothetical protein
MANIRRVEKVASARIVEDDLVIQLRCTQAVIADQQIKLLASVPNS